MGNVVKKWIRRPGSAPDLVSGQQEKNGWVTFDFYSKLDVDYFFYSLDGDYLQKPMMMILCWQDGDDDVALFAGW